MSPRWKGRCEAVVGWSAAQLIFAGAMWLISQRQYRPRGV